MHAGKITPGMPAKPIFPPMTGFGEVKKKNGGAIEEGHGLPVSRAACHGCAEEALLRDAQPHGQVGTEI